MCQAVFKVSLHFGRSWPTVGRARRLAQDNFRQVKMNHFLCENNDLKTYYILPTY